MLSMIRFTFEETPITKFGHFLSFSTSEDRERSRQLETNSKNERKEETYKNQQNPFSYKHLQVINRVVCLAY